MNDAKKIRNFLAKRAAKARPSVKLTKDTPLFGRVLDSFGVMELVAFLEDTFDIHLTRREMGPRRLGTLYRIHSLVRVKKGAKKSN